MTEQTICAPYAWLSHGVLSDPVVAELGFDSRLVKIPDGAILHWRFAEDGDFDYVLLVHLSDEEAQSVSDSRNASAGMIEDIRAELRDADAVVVVAGGVDFGIQHTSVPRDVSETEFVDGLFETAERMHNRIASFTFPRDWPVPTGVLSVIRQAIGCHNASKRD